MCCCCCYFCRCCCCCARMLSQAWDGREVPLFWRHPACTAIGLPFRSCLPIRSVCRRFFTLFILTPELQLLPSLDFVVCTCYVPPLPSFGLFPQVYRTISRSRVGSGFEGEWVTTQLLFAAPECSSNFYSCGWPFFICASICLRVPLCPPPFGPVAASFLYDLTI